MAKTLREAIAENLKYVEGLDDILGRFYYLRDPEELVRAVETWLLQSPEGRAWLDGLGLVNKEAVIKVIDQIEANLEQSNRDLVAKVRALKGYVDARGGEEE